MTPSTLSPAGIELIKRYESCRLQAYLCPAGKLTIGWGHVLIPPDYHPFKVSLARLADIITVNQKTGVIKIPLRITQSQADAFLARDTADTAIFLASMSHTLPKPLSQQQFDALCSFIFNVGQFNYIHSTLHKRIKAGDLDGAAEEFDRWVYATAKGKKVKLNGLVTRRADERRLFDASASLSTSAGGTSALSTGPLRA